MASRGLSPLHRIQVLIERARGFEKGFCPEPR